MNGFFNNILVLAPHTDDGELGCGGTIARFIEEGAVVHYVAFSTADQSIPAHLPKNILSKEVKLATKALNIPTKNSIIASTIIYFYIFFQNHKYQL